MIRGEEKEIHVFASARIIFHNSFSRYERKEIKIYTVTISVDDVHDVRIISIIDTITHKQFHPSKNISFY